MNFVAVDNDGDRLTALAAILTESFPGCTVAEFTDPLLSAKYVLNNEVDAVFAAEQMRPADGKELRHVILLNKPHIKFILLSDYSDKSANAQSLARPITREQIEIITNRGGNHCEKEDS